MLIYVKPESVVISKTEEINKKDFRLAMRKAGQWDNFLRSLDNSKDLIK